MISLPFTWCMSMCMLRAYLRMHYVDFYLFLNTATTRGRPMTCRHVQCQVQSNLCLMYWNNWMLVEELYTIGACLSFSRCMWYSVRPLTLKSWGREGSLLFRLVWSRIEYSKESIAKIKGNGSGIVFLHSMYPWSPLAPVYLMLVMIAGNGRELI